MHRVLALVLLYAFGILNSGLLFADGPADNGSVSVRPIPPLGIELADEQRDSLFQKCGAVRARWTRVLQQSKEKALTGNRWAKAANAKRDAVIRSLSPEVLVFPRAVELAIEFQQFYKPAEIEAAESLLDMADRRIGLIERTADWRQALEIGDGSEQQLIVGGYRSKIDGSAQPYAVVLPAGFGGSDARPRRLDLWFHGRGETLSEVNFLQKGMNNAGQFTPADTFVLHPYGRYSNAFKFAGEVDVLEAMEYLQQRLPIDPHRISVRGFSMGGAGCWQFATRHSDRFFAANPGAGFSETPEFLKSFQGEDLSSTPEYQRKLWQLYDNPNWCRNLIHCPTVAYSGEIDRQKQAADVMEMAMRKHQIQLQHQIGPDTAHKIHPDSAIEVERRMRLLEQQSSTTLPSSVDLTTYTLRYSKMHWMQVNGLEQHWQPSRIQATIASSDGKDTIRISTSGITSASLRFDSGEWRHSLPSKPEIVIDGQVLQGPAVLSDRSWNVDLVFQDDRWILGALASDQLRKRPGLQGPIDDALLDSFLFVMPTGKSPDESFHRWADTESEHAQTHWRKHFRGDIRSVSDQQLTSQHIADHHLVLFGDLDSNSVISKIAKDLPITWTADSIAVGKSVYPRTGHAVIMVYPNPLNPDRYIVLNSGFTFREYDYLNNARQTPKLPDWAVVDIRNGATNRDPGDVIEAGFFDESWTLTGRLHTLERP